MHWIITVDHINGKSEDGSTTKVGYRCASIAFNKAYRAVLPDAKEFMLKGFKADMNYEFRLFDDDGILYYEGLCKDLDQANEDQAFRPLDWAMNDVGCTRMDYRKRGEKEWQTL